MKQLSQTKLADIVKRRRNIKCMTQEQLCVQTGINRTVIGRIERMDYLPSTPQLEILGKVLDFEIVNLFEEKQSTVFTAFRGANLSPEEQDGVEHLFDMMLAVKQQITLKRALNHECISCRHIQNIYLKEIK